MNHMQESILLGGRNISNLRFADDTTLMVSSLDTINVYAAAAAASKSLQSCPTLRPHRQQPTRIPHPWDSQGKNT